MTEPDEFPVAPPGVDPSVSEDPTPEPAHTQKFIVHDAEGNLVSQGTEVAPPEVLEERGYTAVPVDQYAVGDIVWDPRARRLRPASQEEIAARQPALSEDDQFVREASAKLRSGKALTQAERDRLMVIQLSRG